MVQMEAELIQVAVVEEQEVPVQEEMLLVQQQAQEPQ
jgi:hypothetical protein